MKNYYKKKLINNFVKNKKLIKTIIKDKNPNLIFIERKKQLLKRNGFDFSVTELANGNINTIKNKDNDNIIISLNNVIKPLIKNKNIFNLKKIYSNDKEKIKKKKVIDQFEYIKKIIKEQKIIHKKISKSPNDIMTSNYRISKSKISKEKKINTNNNYNRLENCKNDSSIEETCDEYPYSHKKSHRAVEELQLFNRLKKIKQKKKSKEKEQEQKRKLYMRFKNLCKLNSCKLNSERFHNKKVKTFVFKNNLIKKRKEINKYYIGNEIDKNNSTLIEQNDYYYYLYQSHQIISNSNINISNKILEKPPNLFMPKNNLIIKKQNDYNTTTMNTFILKIKTIFAKKFFDNLYQNYNGIKYYYNFYLAINYFIAIIKQYPFNKLYYYNINENEVSNSRSKIYGKKIICFSEILTLFFKFKVFEKLFNYSKKIERKIIEKKLRNMLIAIKNNCLKIFFKYFLERSSKIKININNSANNKKINLINIENELEEEKNSSFDKSIKNLNELKEKAKTQSIESNFKLRNDDKIDNIRYNIRYQENNIIIKSDNNENDFSAERDNQLNIKWEYNCDNDSIVQNIEDKNNIKNEMKKSRLNEENGEFKANNSKNINQKKEKELEENINKRRKNENNNLVIKNNNLDNSIKENEKLSKI